MSIKKDQPINTNGGSGQVGVTVQQGVKYVTVLNPSGYTFSFYLGGSVDPQNLLCVAGATSNVCLPLLLKTPMVDYPILIVWAGATTTDYVQIIFSDEMLLAGGGLTGGAVISNQGSPAAVGNAWPVYVTRGGVANAVGTPLFVELSDGAAVVGTAGNPVRVDPTGTTTQPVRLNPVGAQGNAWNAAVVGAGGTSAVIDCQYNQRVSAFGNSNAATTINLQVSQDGVNFYTAGSQILAAPGDFHITVETGARYARLLSTGAATITATIAAK